MTKLASSIATAGFVAALAFAGVAGVTGAVAKPLPTMTAAPVLESSTAVQQTAARRGGRARVVVVRPRRVVRVVRRPFIVRPAYSRVVVVGDRCAFYRNRWRATGSPVWLRRLNLCRAGVI